jgi:DNA-directed RNA polymerase subunit RPC12/RpoP
MTSPKPPEDKPPVTYRCTSCDYTHPVPYTESALHTQACPKCGQRSEGYEWNGNRWNILYWGAD